MASDAISNQTMAGEALINSATTCSEEDYYYTATYINVDSSVTPYSQISATPSPMSFSAAAGSATQSLSVLGYRGIVYSSTLLTDDCVYSLTSGSECASGSPCIAVGAATGIVAVTGSAMADGDDAVINVAYWDITSGSLTDSVYVAITA